MDEMDFMDGMDTATEFALVGVSAIRWIET